MEKKSHFYEIEGLALDIPLKPRRGMSSYIEDCSDLVDNPKCTTLGHPVILTHYEPCELFKQEIDCCGSCAYFKAASTEHFTLIGICTHQSHNKNF